MELALAFEQALALALVPAALAVVLELPAQDGAFALAHLTDVELTYS